MQLIRDDPIGRRNLFRQESFPLDFIFNIFFIFFRCFSFESQIILDPFVKILLGAFGPSPDFAVFGIDGSSVCAVVVVFHGPEHVVIFLRAPSPICFLQELQIMMMLLIKSHPGFTDVFFPAIRLLISAQSWIFFSASSSSRMSLSNAPRISSIFAS